jgi:hypothetical protein
MIHLQHSFGPSLQHAPRALRVHDRGAGRLRGTQTHIQRSLLVRRSEVSSCREEGWYRGKALAMRLVVSIVMLGLLSSGAWAETAAPATKSLHFFRTEHGARTDCPDDRVVWASTSSHALYLPGDRYYGHTRGGFVCESAARARGFRGPTAYG